MVHLARRGQHGQHGRSINGNDHRSGAMTSGAEPALQQSLRAALEGSPLFAGLPPERILQLEPTPQTLAEGQTLFRQG